MAKIEKSEESGPQLFFNFTWKYVPQLFLGTPRAEKMTFSQKTARVWFDDTYPLNQWHVLSGKILVSPLEQFVKHHFGSADMCTRFVKCYRLSTSFHCIGDMIFDNYPLKMSQLVWVRKNGTIEGMFDILWHQLSILSENWKFQIQPVIYCSIKSGDMGLKLKNIPAVAGDWGRILRGLDRKW